MHTDTFTRLHPATKAIRTFTRHHSTEILTGTGVVGVISTAYLSAKAALDLDEHCREHTNWSLRDRWANGSKKRTLKDAVPFFSAPVLSGALTITSIVGANRVAANQTAVIAGAYALSEKALDEYRSSVKRSLGEEKVRGVEEKVAQTKLQKDPIQQNFVFLTGNGEDLCYDSISGRYFRSSVEAMRKAENDVNHELFNDTWVSLNRLYDFLGLEHIKLGEELGWSTDNLLQLAFSTQLATDNTPCVVLNYVVDPKLDPYRY